MISLLRVSPSANEGFCFGGIPYVYTNRVVVSIIFCFHPENWGNDPV